jgi:hypothetical protein
MGEALDRKHRAFWFRAKRSADELDESPALFHGLLMVIWLADLRAVFCTRRWADGEIISHGAVSSLDEPKVFEFSHERINILAAHIRNCGNHLQAFPLRS